MDADDLEPRKRRGEALTALCREDLTPMGLAELEERVAALEAEIARIKAQMERKRGDRSAAEAFFKSPSR